MSQTTKLLQMLRQNKIRGVENYKFPQRQILRYSARIADLRADGYNIYCERVVINGRATGTFKYYLIEEEDKPSLLSKFKKVIGVK